MNFVGHMHVATLVEADHPAWVHEVDGSGTPVRAVELRLGSAAPDFATMARQRLVPVGSGPAATGVRLHHRVDAAFHDHPDFRRLCSVLRGALRSAQVPRGAARACGHVGVELLLDGELMRRPSIAESVDQGLAALDDPSAGLVELVAAEHRSRWTAALQRIGARIDPGSLRDPQQVATRLHRVLGSRPRLRLPDDQVGIVAEALVGVQPSVAAVAEGLVTDVHAALARGTRT